MTENIHKPNKFVFAITLHPEFGYLIEPFSIKLNTDRSFSIKSSPVQFANINHALYDISEAEAQLVKIIEEYSDRNILKRFGTKAKSFEEFVKKELTPDRFEKVIRPVIDRRVNVVLNKLAENGIGLYYKGLWKDYIKDNKISIHATSAEIVFNFERNEEGIKYFLSIKGNDKIINLFNSQAIFVGTAPVWLLINNIVYCFSPDYHRKNLEPFILKEFISIPKSFEDKYFNSFIYKTIKNHEVNVKGFEVEFISVRPVPLLTIQRHWNTGVSLNLSFQYGDQVISSDYLEPNVVILNKKGDDYSYRKITRDVGYEEEIKNHLKALGLDYLSGNCYVPAEMNVNLPADYEYSFHSLISWVNRHRSELDNYSIEIKQEADESIYYTGEIHLEFKVSDKIDWFDIYAVVNFGKIQIPFIKFRKNIVRQIREYVLPDGAIVILPLEWFTDYKELMIFSSSTGDNMHLNKRIISLAKNTGKKLPLDILKEEKGTGKKKISIENITVPEKLNATLRAYQFDGYNWLYHITKNDFNCCLADDMGLGKTIQTLTLLQKIKEEENSNPPMADQIPNSKSQDGVNNGEGKETDMQLDLFSKPVDVESGMASLIVVPTSLIYNWVNEIKKFAPDLKYYIHSGVNRIKKGWNPGFYDVVITSYGILRKDQELFKDFMFNYLILDESQHIKNPESKIFEAVCEIKSKHRIVLTGTPIENSLSDLWSQMTFLNPGLLGSLTAFKKTYINPIEKEGNNSMQGSLQSMIYPFILRRKKSEVLKELPEITENLYMCEMTDDQKSFYESKKSQIRNYIFSSMEGQGNKINMISVLKGLTELRMIANHPKMFDKTYESDSGKFEAVIDNLENVLAEGHKVLVFSSFVRHLSLFSDYLKKNKIGFATLTGSTPESKRENIINSFQNNKDVKVFLISIKAGGFGLNLTAADYVLVLDPWWNPAVEIQAINRTHRIGQEKKVFSYKFITKDTVEEKILLLQEKKKILADVFVNQINPLRQLKEKEIMGLFE